MKIGIVGLGLIGGSIAKAYKRLSGITVLGWDRDPSVMAFAKMAEAIDDELSLEHIKSCDCIILAMYPQGVIDWVRERATHLSSQTLVVDCSGTKEKICETLFPVAKEYGFTFVGGHPMAGTHHSTFKHSREDLFDGAQMIVVPPAFEDEKLLERVRQLLLPIGFQDISFTTAKNHDEIIAFTSQMPHLISNGFIKSETALLHRGFSAGSYRDLTRVAQLSPHMWTELFLENQKNLLKEIDAFMENMSAYREAIQACDAQKLEELLEMGRQRKKEVDGPRQ